MEHLTRADYPVHEIILSWQDQILSELLSSMTLGRLLDSELKVPTGQDAFTAAELLERLTASIFQETEKLNNGKFTNRKPAILSLRRSLQRKYLERLANLAMGNTSARTIAKPLRISNWTRWSQNSTGSLGEGAAGYVYEGSPDGVGGADSEDSGSAVSVESAVNCTRNIERLLVADATQTHQYKRQQKLPPRHPNNLRRGHADSPPNPSPM